MFVGHYAVSLAAKRYAPDTSLGWTFLAVQFLDILWAPLVLFGIERARIVPGFLPASSVDLYYMPWSHSLVMAAAWSWIVYRVSKIPVLGMCVFSHWLLDFVAHAPDLSLLKGPPYVGLGLWRSRPATFLTEAVLLVLGVWLYLRATRPKNTLGRFGMPVFVALLIALNWYNIYGPPPDPTSATSLLIGAEVCYAVFAAVAWWLDRSRISDATAALPVDQTVRTM